MKDSTPSITSLIYLATTGLLCSVSLAAVPVDYYSDVIPYTLGDSQFTVSGVGGGLTLGGAPTELKVVVFAEIFRAGAYHIVGSLDNYSIRTKYPNGYGNIRLKTETVWGLLDGERPDRYVAGVDYNGDGHIGLWDSTTESLSFDAGEYVSPAQISVSGVPTIQSGSGFQVRAIAIVPEPTSGLLILICTPLLALSARPRRPNQALQRTRSAVTLAASCRRLSPATQPARQLRESLSLGSLGDSPL